MRSIIITTTIGKSNVQREPCVPVAKHVPQRAFALALCVLALTCSRQAFAWDSTVAFTSLSGIYAINFESTFHGHQSAVDRDLTGSSNWTGSDLQEAYDYSAHVIRDTQFGLYRLYTGGRWRRSTRNWPWEPWTVLGDGDHILQHTSNTGAGGTWTMPYQRPEFWQGQEEGNSGTWYARNYLEPEVVKVGGTYYMYSQVMILPGDPIDIPGQYASVQCDRLQLHTSADGYNWTRWSTQRGVVTNITNPTYTNLDHQEVIYVPWDSDGRPFWLYTFHFVNSQPAGHVRIRSSDPTTFNWLQREGTGLAELGNQIGYASQAPGAPLYARITFTDDGTGRRVPSMQFSRDGLSWSFGSSAVKLAGSSDNINNRNCYFLGMSTINGTGELEYLGNNTYRAIYAATTCNTPVAPDIFKSEIGVGEVKFQLLYDNIPPTGSVKINGDAAYTSSAAVTLTINANDLESGVTHMRFSNNSTSWSGWQSYATGRSWTLNSGEGTRTVYAQFRDSVGNISQTYSDTILLDTVAPSAPGIPTDIGAYTTSPTITFNWSPASDSGSGIQGYYCQIGTSPGAGNVFNGYLGSVTSKAVTGSYGNTYYCRAQARDRAGNLSAWSASSDGIMIVQHGGLSIAQLKQLPNEVSVGLSGKVITAVFADAFYIQEIGGISGIRVQPNAILDGISVGTVVDMAGTLRLSSSGERYMDAAVVTAQ